MSDKLFKNDKNYILKSVQNDTKKELLNYLFRKSLEKYELKSNSLGLVDKSFRKFYCYNNEIENRLSFFYRKISTIYRYNYGEVQLSFLWDGSSHNDFYKNQWTKFFKNEVTFMIEKNTFLKTVLSLTKLKSDNINLLQYNLSAFIRKKFNMQVFKKKGLVLHSQ